ncbi:hypothetical protein BLNAU_15938 [Blattamonas nauphoetae]|uniref:Uncharacterized protein n=1 Tax=Blattamonas nauphoetae TaxID=2049346 RepID=A0ABQ9XCR9_9EUKA|nr:hypothetical protein BLNAU_15938 [Blattamonas nauphoetae]
MNERNRKKAIYMIGAPGCGQSLLAISLQAAYPGCFEPIISLESVDNSLNYENAFTFFFLDMTNKQSWEILLPSLQYAPVDVFTWRSALIVVKSQEQIRYHVNPDILGQLRRHFDYMSIITTGEDITTITHEAAALAINSSHPSSAAFNCLDVPNNIWPFDDD